MENFTSFWTFLFDLKLNFQSFLTPGKFYSFFLTRKFKIETCLTAPGSEKKRNENF